MRSPARVVRGARRRATDQWRRASYRLRQPDGPKRVYVSHHKCATQWTMAVLRDLAAPAGWPDVKGDWRRPLTNAEIAANHLLLLQDWERGVVDLDALAPIGVHVVRDPRDVLVSLYFSHRDSHPSKTDATSQILRDRRVLADLDLDAGLCFLMDESHYWQRVTTEMAAWDYQRPDFLETTYERLVADPATEFGRVCDHLGLPTDRLGDALDRHSFANLRSRWSAGHEAETNHYRSGRAGDWETHLTGAARTRFAHRHGDLLVQLGYANDPVEW